MKTWKMWLQLMALVSVLAIANDALALSQWARKYKVNCATCHSAFPRLNAYGDAFMQNGYQIPGSEDGDEDAKLNIADNLKLSELTDIFGIRVSLTPLSYKTDSRTKADGSKGDNLNVGKADWVQLFVGGTIARNVGVFIENEVTPDSVHINWFHVSFNNLLVGSYANIRVGRLSAFNWHAMPGRLRGIAPVKNEVFGGYKSSNGKGDDSVAIASPYPAVEYYGYNQYLLWVVGVQNGGKATDVNEKKNFYATLKAWLAQNGDFAGSAISIGSLAGTDTKALKATTNSAGVVTSATEADNTFWRAGPALNIRYRDTDFQTAYFVGNDDNWKLVGPNDPETSVDFQGLSALLGQWLTKMWWAGLQYDWIDSDDNTADFNKGTATVSYSPREHIRIYLIGRADLKDSGDKEHEALVNVRAMF